MELHVISAGAAKGIVSTLGERLQQAQGATIVATFGAVGAMREKLLSGQRCDVVVLTQAMIASLASDGHVVGRTIGSLGVVYTGIAVRAGDPVASVESEAALHDTLSNASSIHFPDPTLATAGIHFAKVLRALRLHETLAPRLRPYPNGAAAMAALASAVDARPIGCTQVSEILYTRGVTLAGVLPKAFELSTRYDAAVSVRAANATLAEAFVTLVAGETARPLRAAGGFHD